MVEMCIQHGQRLVVKWPHDALRMDFLAAMFPDAMFIHIIRHGVEVARSIAKMAAEGRWYGDTGYYLHEVLSSARERGYAVEVDSVQDDFDRGMLEWRLHVEAAQASARNITNHPYLEVRYEELLGDPVGTCQELEEFIGIPPDKDMRGYATTHVQRRSPVVERFQMTSHIDLIAGGLLRRLGYGGG